MAEGSGGGSGSGGAWSKTLKSGRTIGRSSTGQRINNTRGMGR